jgi:hypothetical protein
MIETMQLGWKINAGYVLCQAQSNQTKIGAIRATARKK